MSGGEGKGTTLVVGLSGAADASVAARFAVDSWFYDNGLPAAILPLADWNAGHSPNVGG